MNIKLFTIALLVSALPHVVLADSAVSLNKGDFLSAERKSPNGETVVSVKLSKSGKAKLKKLNKESGNKEVHVEIAGVTADLKFVEPIEGDGLEMGPYSSSEGNKIVTEINRK